MSDWIRESNLIEGVDDPMEDTRCLRAWEWLVKYKGLELELVLALHGRIMETLNPDIAGKLRTCDVTVGGYLAPGWQRVETFLDAWMDLKWPWRQSHVLFEAIHPFEDGNGRVGRMLMNWQRVQEGLEPLLILATKRQDYYKWFR